METSLWTVVVTFDYTNIARYAALTDLNRTDLIKKKSVHKETLLYQKLVFGIELPYSFFLFFVAFKVS